MAITINGKTYRNLQEQVEENVKDIEDLQDRPISYSKEESDAKFQTKIGMALYATQQQLNLNIAATEARTDLLLANKQDTLVSGTNIKTVNGNSLVGSGNIQIGEGGTTYTAGTGIDITNDVISVDSSVLTTSTAAEVAMTGSYNDLSNTPNLAAVATSGAYNDLSGKPNLAAVATTGDYNDLINKPTEHTYYCTMKIKTTDNKTYVFSKYFTTTENVMPSSGHNWYGANMLKYIRYGGSVWFCSSTGDASNIPVQTLIYADYTTSGSSYIFDAYNINGYMNTFTMNLSNCNVYLNEV